MINKVSKILYEKSKYDDSKVRTYLALAMGKISKLRTAADNII